jgi:PAS domain S-box-containing protein
MIWQRGARQQHAHAGGDLPPRRHLLESPPTGTEQDAELRFTRVEVRNDAAFERGLAQRILGKKRWETGLDIEGGWDAHRAMLESRAPFRDVLMWRNMPDGARRYISVSGEPTFDSRGRFTGYRGMGRDITKQKRIQQLLKLDHAVTLRLAEARRARDERALQVICDCWLHCALWAPGEAMACSEPGALAPGVPARALRRGSGGLELPPARPRRHRLGDRRAGVGARYTVNGARSARRSRRPPACARAVFPIRVGGRSRRAEFAAAASASPTSGCGRRSAPSAPRSASS